MYAVVLDRFIANSTYTCIISFTYVNLVVVVTSLKAPLDSESSCVCCGAR